MRENERERAEGVTLCQAEGDANTHTHTHLINTHGKRERLDSSIILDAAWLRTETGATMHS